MLEHAVPLALLLARAYGVSLAAQTIIGAGFAAAAAYLIPEYRRIQLPKVEEFEAKRETKDPLAFTKNEWKREIPLILKNTVLQAAIFAGLDELRHRGYIKLSTVGLGAGAGSKWDTFRLVAGQFVAYFFAFDLYYYFLHRFVLHSSQFWWIHEPHHKSFTPSPLTGFVFHPIEALITGGFVHLVAYLCNGKFHAYTFAGVLLWGLADNLFVHLGYQILPTWFERSKYTNWLMTTNIHDIHHSKVRCAYGGFSTIWDRVFGTLPEDVVEGQLNRIDQQIQDGTKQKD